MAIDNVKDPKIYPAVFSLARRELSVVDNMTATTTFVASGTRAIKSAHYFHDGIYILDVDHTSASSVSFVGTGKKLIFEFLSDSANLSSSRFNVKAWINESSYKMFSNKEFITLRQPPWTFATTESSFYVSNTMKQFSSVSVTGIPYYASVGVDVVFYPEYYVGKTITPCSVTPGNTVTKEVINVEDYGLLTMLFTLSVSWYYDQDRTLPVSSPPPELESQMGPKTFVARLIFVAPGKFFFMGGISSDGLAVFDGVLTQNYVLSSGIDYGSFTFVGLNSTTDELFVGQESEVIVDDNGYCIKEGHLNQIYFV